MSQRMIFLGGFLVCAGLIAAAEALLKAHGEFAHVAAVVGREAMDAVLMSGLPAILINGGIENIVVMAMAAAGPGAAVNGGMKAAFVAGIE